MMRRQKADRKRQDRRGHSWAFRLGVFAFCLLPSAFASDASADIVVFKTGRTMSVKSYSAEGDTATLMLRDGGSVTFPASIVVRVDPDEVPYPEPAPPPATTVAAVPAADAVRAQPRVLVSDSELAARPFAGIISAAAARHSVDLRLVHAVIEQESNYEPRARSPKGARGLMQLMPQTARQYGVRNTYDPTSNIEAGVRHLKDLMSRLEMPTALAAYNAGEATIRRFGGLPPYPETQNYVRKILERVGR